MIHSLIGNWMFPCGLILALPGAVVSQQYNFKVYSVEDGLAQSQVHALFQDSKGYLWAGTSGGGVSRFDGKAFVNFTTADGLSDNSVYSLLEDHHGHLWLGTGKGVSRYDGRSFTPFTEAEGPLSTKVRALVEDRHGDLWLGTEAGLSRFDGRTFTHWGLDDGLPNDEIRALARDRHGNLWVGTASGLLRFDGRSFAPFTAGDGLADGAAITALLEDRDGALWIATYRGVGKYDGERWIDMSTVADGERLASVKTMLEDGAGNLWFGTEGAGAARYNGRGLTFFGTANGLSSDRVWSLLEDREGNLWFGTYRGGMCRFEGERFVHFTTKEGLGDPLVRSVLEDRQGRLWVGTQGGASVFEGDSFHTLTTKDGLVDDFVLTIMEDQAANLWFGTLGGVSRYDGQRFTNFTVADGLSGRFVRSILEDRQGALWFGTNSNGISRYDGVAFTHFDTTDGLNSNAIMTLLEDRGGALWVGTDSGVNLYRDGAFVDIFAGHELSAATIHTILEDEAGDLWFGVYGLGVIHYAATGGGTFEHITRQDGLSDNNVVLLAFDRQQRLWVGTERGVDRIKLGEPGEGPQEIHFFGKEEGFAGIECVHNAVLAKPQGEMWFGTIYGATRYAPQADHSTVVPPLVYITDVRLFFGEVDRAPYVRSLDGDSGLPRGLELPHDMNHVTFDFIAPVFTHPLATKYWYKLEGLDEKWRSSGGEGSVTYSSLPPGNFVFKVLAETHDGVRSREAATFELLMRKPFWQRWWFRITTLLLLAMLVFTLHELRVRRAERQQEQLRIQVLERTREVTRQKNELEAQKNEIERKNTELDQFASTVSHDLRSPLFTIKMSLGLMENDIAKGDEERVRKDLQYANRAADQMELRLESILKLARAGRIVEEWREISLGDIVQEAVQLLDGSLLARGVEVVVAENMPTVLGDRNRLLQVVQNALENSIKFMGDQRQPSIRVAGVERGEDIVVSVEDNGIGIDPRYMKDVFALFSRLNPEVEGTGLGLAMARKIIEAHGGKVWMESDGPGRGAKFFFTLAGRGSSPGGKRRPL